MAEDFYRELGVSKTASADEIKKSYRKLARELHPDRNPGNKSAEERFKKVAYAYDILSDKEKRPLYDEFGEQGLSAGFNPEQARAYARYAGAGGARGGARQVNVEDIFGGFDASSIGDMFGGRDIGDIFGQQSRGGARGRRRGRAGADVSAGVKISFAESMLGGEKELIVRDPRGKTDRTVKVRIPAGARTGSKLRLRGQGADGADGGPSGDMLLDITVEDHSHFKWMGDELVLELPVTPKELYDGAKVRVPTPGGDVTLKIPARTQSGTPLRVREKGAPQRGGGRSDLIVRLMVRIPTDDRAETQKAVDELSTTLGDVREAVKI